VSVPVAVHRRGGLVARFGADIALPDLLLALAQCERRQDMRRAVRLSGTPNLIVLEVSAKTKRPPSRPATLRMHLRLSFLQG